MGGGYDGRVMHQNSSDGGGGDYHRRSGRDYRRGRGGRAEGGDREQRNTQQPAPLSHFHHQQQHQQHWNTDDGSGCMSGSGATEGPRRRMKRRNGRGQYATAVREEDTSSKGASSAGHGTVTEVPPAITGAGSSSSGNDMSAARCSGEAGALLDSLLESLVATDVMGASQLLLKLAKENVVNEELQEDSRVGDGLRRLLAVLRQKDASVAPGERSGVKSRELSDIAFALGKLQLVTPDMDELLEFIARTAIPQIHTFTPHDMAGIAWGFASLGMRNEALMSVIAAEVVTQKESFDQRHLAITAWAFAKCGLWNEKLVKDIVFECRRKLSTFTASSLSHIAWAMAQWCTRDDAFMNAIAAEALPRASEFSPRPLAMTAWSFASLQIHNTKLMHALVAEAHKSIETFSITEIAHFSWSLAQLRILDAELFNRIAIETQMRCSQTRPAELANIAWAFSKTSNFSEALMSCIAEESFRQIRGFKAAETAMIMWAFAAAGHEHKPLFSEFGTQVARRFDKYTQPQLSHVAWAFGAMAMCHQPFFQCLAKAVRANTKSFKASLLPNIVWAFAMVGIRDEEMLGEIANEIARDASELRPMALARCAWAYASLTVHSAVLVSAVRQEAIRHLADFPTKALQRVIDAFYTSADGAADTVLEVELSRRTQQVAILMKSLWPNWQSVVNTDATSYARGLQEVGVWDLGMVGTPQLLELLGIELPRRHFLTWCQQQGFLESGLTRKTRPFASGRPPRRDFSAAEYELTFGRVYRKDRIVRKVESEKVAAPCEILIVVDLEGRSGAQEYVYLVLSTICSIIKSMGVDFSSEASCKAVSGCVQVLSASTLCLSSVGAMRQFQILFPSIVLESMDLVGEQTD